MTGDFVWHELRTTDAAGALAFYSHVVGWHGAGSNVPGHTMLQSDGVPVAGLLALPSEALANGAGSAWVGYVVVTDADAATASALADGATLRAGPMDIPGFGRCATITDPHGAPLALVQTSLTSPASTGQYTPGRVGWCELVTTAQDEALAWYAARFGWMEAGAVDMGPRGTYQLFANGGPAFGGIMPGQGRPHWLFYFTVPDIDAAVARVLIAGGQLTQGPHPVPGGSQILHGLDPQGARFALVQGPPPPASLPPG